MLEDDPYGLVRYEGEALPSLFELSGGAAIYSSSFSKTIAPGLRVGWFVFPEELAREIEATATSTYITPVLLGQATVHEFVSRGLFEPNLERVVGLLRARRDAMLAALDRELPDVRDDAARGRLLPLARARRRRRGRAAAARRGGRRHVRQGHRLRRRAGDASPRLQLRLARRDRRRRRAPRVASS